jgi:hypothetical protein
MKSAPKRDATVPTSGQPGVQDVDVEPRDVLGDDAPARRSDGPRTAHGDAHVEGA